MQSGITASQELHDAFKSFLDTPSQLAVLVSISDECLMPTTTIDSKGQTFPNSISLVHDHLEPNQAAYILLRTHTNLVAITYVPDTAPVRSKMLFASTRLTLVRELGTEHFADALFVTDRHDVSVAGWTAHEKSREAENPLTASEIEIKMLREEDAGESVGTAARRAQYAMTPGAMGQGLALEMSSDLSDAFTRFKGLGTGFLMTIKFDVTTETLQLDVLQQNVSASALASVISSSDPRYAFYKYDAERIMFLYTCPGSSKIKERMIYASGRAKMLSLAESEAGLVIAKKLEASSPDELTEQVLADEFIDKPDEAIKGFARPKRPGRK